MSPAHPNTSAISHFRQDAPRRESDSFDLSGSAIEADGLSSTTRTAPRWLQSSALSLMRQRKLLRVGKDSHVEMGAGAKVLRSTVPACQPCGTNMITRHVPMLA